MKLKITNFWIPTTLVLIGLLGMMFFVLVGESNYGEIGIITAIACGLILIFVYLPIITVQIFRDKILNKEKIVLNIGAISIALMVLSYFMRLFNVPGGSLVVILSSTMFYLNFLPSWYAAQWKDTDKLGRFFYFVFCACLGTLILSVQFKTMHWPGANAMASFALYTTLIGLVPLCIILFFKKDKSYFSLSTNFLFGFIFAFILSGYLSSKLVTKATANTSTTHVAFEKNISLYYHKSQFLYEALSNSKSSDTSFVFYKNRALELQKKSNELFNYIQKLKTELIKKTDNLDELSPDSVRYEDISDKTNYDIPTYMMGLSDPEKPVTGPFTALELKSKIETFITELPKILPDEYVPEYKQNLPFDLSDVEEEDAQVSAWEVHYFYHENLGMIYSTLTNFQADVRYIEMNALNELFNKANSSNKDNIAAQLTELAIKYESTKKEKAISELQKDKELNDVKLQAKDVEISSREKTIAYFIFALIGFGISTIFIVRSNILRKKMNQELAIQKAEIEQQKHLVEEKHKEITDSINYAERIQKSFLATKDTLDENLKDYFIFFKPKDVVSGDFYWAETLLNGNFALATADSTGHGVPGSIMSLLNITSLEKAIETESEPANILNTTRNIIINRLKKDGSPDGGKDGMDCSLVVFDRKNNKLIVSAAHNPVWIVRGTQVIEIKADKMPVGKHDNQHVPFTQHEMDLQKGDIVYTLTDGFPDQFGGDKGKKFMSKNLRELLLANASVPMAQQKDLLENTFTTWKQNLEQVDDVTVIGVKI